MFVLLQENQIVTIY